MKKSNEEILEIASFCKKIPVVLVCGSGNLNRLSIGGYKPLCVLCMFYYLCFCFDLVMSIISYPQSLNQIARLFSRYLPHQTKFENLGIAQIL